MKRFAILGVGGYVAPRHLKAIKDTGNELVAAYDKSDSVGIIDQYFPKSSFFTEQELFDRHCSKLKATEQRVDYVSVCTPNYLHDAHARYGLRLGADVICEKPLVLNPWNIDALEEIEQETGKRIYNILQLRLHPAIVKLREQTANNRTGKKHDIDLTYITSRGNWYHISWKGDLRKSGGIATNIGVHFYDMLLWIFGEVKQNTVHVHTHDRVAGYLELEHANIRYFMSINAEHLPETALKNGKTTYRSMLVDGEEFDFSDGFTELHTESYKRILLNEGFGLKDARPCIQLVHDIRQQTPIGLKGEYHPLAKTTLSPHPSPSNLP